MKGRDKDGDWWAVGYHRTHRERRTYLPPYAPVNPPTADLLHRGRQRERERERLLLHHRLQQALPQGAAPPHRLLRPARVPLRHGALALHGLRRPRRCVQWTRVLCVCVCWWWDGLTRICMSASAPCTVWPFAPTAYLHALLLCAETPTTGGPDQNDQYRDDCQNYKQAEVAIDYVSPCPPFVRTRIDPRQSD